jgi:hypothetical protein
MFMFSCFHVPAICTKTPVVLKKTLTLQAKLTKEMYRILTVLVLLALVACEKDARPKGLISETKMVDILYDIHLSGAVGSQMRYDNGRHPRIRTRDIYLSVLNSHGITDSMLAVSIIYYSDFPKKYEKIYSQVVDRLNSETEHIKMLEEQRKNRTMDEKLALFRRDSLRQVNSLRLLRLRRLLGCGTDTLVPWLVAPPDTLSVSMPVDSLSARPDTLIVSPGSLTNTPTSNRTQPAK